MAVTKRSIVYAQHSPIQSQGVPQISTSTPRKEFLMDSGVSFASEDEKSLSCPYLFDTLSEGSWSPTLAASRSFDDLDKTLCHPSGTKSHQIIGPNQTRSRRLLLQTQHSSPSFWGRNVYFRRNLEWDANQTMIPQRLGVRRQLFDLHSSVPKFNVSLLSQSLPDMRGSYRLQNGNSWHSNQPLPEFSTKGSPRTAIHQPCFKVPNMVTILTDRSFLGFFFFC